MSVSEPSPGSGSAASARRPASARPAANARRPPRAVVLFGNQRFDATVRNALDTLEVDGPIATITTGWQEREAEDRELIEHLGCRTFNLMLHHRADEVFARDRTLRDAHRKRQETLRHKQDFYRIRLEHALDANHVIRQRRAPTEILADEQTASIEAIRELDRYHLAQCERVHAEFEAALRPFERPHVAAHRRELADMLAQSVALAITGGHVATILNRLRLFGIAELLDGQVVCGWSGGAMVLTDRVVLFHDSPPQGRGAAEVLDRGLGLAPGVVVLPQPETRLKLADEELVSVLARRFAPARCIAFPSRTEVTVMQTEGLAPEFVRPTGILELGTDGATEVLGIAPPPPSRPGIPATFHAEGGDNLAALELGRASNPGVSARPSAPLMARPLPAPLSRPSTPGLGRDSEPGGGEGGSG
ncbi:MAG: hypothetical protein EXR75_09995 [Myxococcales bacterium]|nr:hypothetical protein [Myxococcales bacterium]